MSSYLKSYEMVLHTKGPVYVGSGKELTKKEYIFLRNKGKVLIPDSSRMYLGLREMGLERQFEDYMLSNQQEQMRMDLGRWLRENQVSLQQYRDWIRYELDCGDFLQEKGAIQIKTFQKDTYDEPYVSGSAIKGMLRTILLSYELLADRKRDSAFQERVYSAARISKGRNFYLQQERRSLEEKVFHTLKRQDKKGKLVDTRNAVNDCLSGLIISDSKPLSVKDLVLCQKLDENIHGKQRALNLLRESLKPNCEICFRLTIDTKLCPYTIEDILEAVKLFGESYYEMYLSHFTDVNKPKEHTVWLGGGVGFYTKTVLYPLLGKDKGLETTVNVLRNTFNERIFKEHKHNQDRSLGVSPHILKCTKYKGVRYQMGECEISVSKEL